MITVAEGVVILGHVTTDNTQRERDAKPLTRIHRPHSWRRSKSSGGNRGVLSYLAYSRRFISKVSSVAHAGCFPHWRNLITFPCITSLRRDSNLKESMDLTDLQTLNLRSSSSCETLRRWPLEIRVRKVENRDKNWRYLLFPEV